MSRNSSALVVPLSRMPVILGAGGGGPKATTPREPSDNYRSASYLLAVELLSEGPIVGPVDISGRVITDPDEYGKAIYFNKVPLLTDAGTFTIGSSTRKQTKSQDEMHNPTYADLDIAFTLGTQSQPYVDHFPSAEEVLTPGDGNMSSILGPNKEVVPILRPIVQVQNSDADTIEVGVQIQGLVKQDKKTGDISGNKIGWIIEVSLNGGDFETKAAVYKDRKITAPAIVASLVTLPKSSVPENDFWLVRVTKTTADPETSVEKSACALSYIRVSTNVKLTYPNCAMVYARLDSANVQSLPTRGYRIKGLMVQVPSNYFPNTATYNRNQDGSTSDAPRNWNGTFYLAWTDNPAWVIYDLMTNTRYGLGNYIAPENVDKWSLYRIAQHCDELVPDGKGGQERRFTFNSYIQTQQDAFKMIQTLASAFMAAVYWGAGVLNFIQDRKIASNEVVYTFTNANVFHGVFDYTSSAASTRHTVCNVQWNDPTDFYQPKYETYQDVNGIHRYGIRTLSIPALGATTRGQAIRLARLLLWSEINQTQVVSFSAGFEAAYLRPGDVVKVMDNDYTALSNGGRIKSISDDRRTVYLDRPLGTNPYVPAPEMDGGQEGQQGTLSFIRSAPFSQPSTVTSSDQTGSLRASQLLQVNYVPDERTTHDGIVNLTEPLDNNIQPGGVWIYEGAVKAQLYRILNVVEKTKNEYQVMCSQYSDAKYDFVDEEHIDIPPVITNLPNPTNVMPPQNLWVETGYINTPEGVQRVLYLHWKKPNDPSVRDFIVEVQFNNNTFETINANCADETISYVYSHPGDYTFRVTSTSNLGLRSLSAVVTFTVNEDVNPLSQFSIRGLELYGLANGLIFGGKDAKFTWQVVSPVNSDPIGGGTGIGGLDPMFDHFDITVYRITDGKKIYQTSVTETKWSFLFEANALAVADGELAPSGPYRAFRVQVKGFDKYGNESNSISIVVENPVPDSISAALTNPSVFTIGISFSPLTDLDYAGVVILGSPDADCPIVLENIVAQGPANRITFNQPAGSTWYYRIGAYDVFWLAGGRLDELNFSDPVAGTNDLIKKEHFTQDLRTELDLHDAVAHGIVDNITGGQDGVSAWTNHVNVTFAVVDDNSASIHQIQQTIVDNQGASAQAITDLRVEFHGEIQTSIAEATTSILTTVGQGFATAQSVTNLAASVFGPDGTGNTAGALHDLKVYVSNDFTLASDTLSLSTTVADHNALLMIHSESLRGIHEEYTISLSQDGQRVAGIKLIGGLGIESKFEVEADKFKLKDSSGNLLFKMSYDGAQFYTPVFGYGNANNGGNVQNAVPTWSIQYWGEATFTNVVTAPHA